LKAKIINYNIILIKEQARVIIDAHIVPIEIQYVCWYAVLSCITQNPGYH